MKTAVGIVLVVIAFIVLYIIIMGIAYIARFHIKPCKYCGHIMEFRGEKKRQEGEVYLFQCPKCKAWEEVPKEEFLKLNINEIS